MAYQKVAQRLLNTLNSLDFTSEEMSTLIKLRKRIDKLITHSSAIISKSEEHQLTFYIDQIDEFIADNYREDDSYKKIEEVYLISQKNN